MAELLNSPKLKIELEGQMTTQNLIHRSYNKLRDAGSYVVYCCYSSSSHIGCEDAASNSQ